MPLPALPFYAELDCLSNFTFLRGASHPEELVVRAQAHGYSALAISTQLRAFPSLVPSGGARVKNNVTICFY